MKLYAIMYPQDDAGKSYVGWLVDDAGLWRGSYLTATSRTKMLTALKAEAKKVRAITSKIIPERVEV